MKLTDTAQYFLLVDFGRTFIHFFLIEASGEDLNIFGPIDIPRLFFEKSSNAESIFKEGIRELEKESQRKLLSSGILIISSGRTKQAGVDQALFIDGEDLKDKIGFFKAIEPLDSNECLNSAFDYLYSLDSSFRIIDAGSSEIRFIFQKDNQRKSISSPFGTGKGALYLLREEYDPERILRWLPFEMDIIELENFIANKSLFPQTLPFSGRDLALLGATLREMLKLGSPKDFLKPEEKPKILISGAAFSKSPLLEQSILILLDGLEPFGICEFYLDRYQLLPCFGAMARNYSNLMPKIYQPEKLFIHLVTTISIGGEFGEGESLGEVYLDFGFDEKQEIRVFGGGLYFIPCGKQEVELSFKLSPKCLLDDKDLKLSEKDRKDKAPRKIKIKSGEKGLVIDVRGRPLSCPRPSLEGREKLKKWHKSLSVDHGICGRESI